MFDEFCCPVCKGSLTAAATSLCCAPCGREFEIVDGVPDFFISETDRDAIAINDPNKAWLDPEIVEARDTYYNLCTRQLKGMTFCMQEIARRTRSGCRVLEVGMGTGHFTRWLAEVAEPGTEIYGFDFSWPIIEKAKVKAGGLPGVALFRANARGMLPFEDASFDIVLERLAPLGPRGVPSARAAFELLKPGGWLFEGGWKRPPFETPPAEWAIQHGFESAEHHVWQYWRAQTERGQVAMEVERERMASLGRPFQGETREKVEDGVRLKMTHENLLIAQKPGF
jgi:SAM-dependent methyltransferase